MKIKGEKAIEAKANDNTVILCKYADPTEGARENISIDEAREIAKIDPSLIYGVVKKEYVVGVGAVNLCNTHTVVANGLRHARTIYTNLYAPPGTKFSDTRAVEKGKEF